MVEHRSIEIEVVDTGFIITTFHTDNMLARELARDKKELLTCIAVGLRCLEKFSPEWEED